MRRFFFETKKSDNIANTGSVVELTESESRHISRVIRLKPGAQVELLDGRGNVFTARLLETGKKVSAEITGVLTKLDSGKVTLHIGQGLLKGQKMDMVVQKCTELGVTQLLPFWSIRCQGKLNDAQCAKKTERYQRIVESACKQCYRPDLMTVNRPQELSTLLGAFPDAKDSLRLLFWEEERETSLHDITVSAATREVVILLGPEGGLHEDEVEMAREQGWQTVSLGKRILRAETATLTSASIVQFMVNNI